MLYQFMDWRIGIHRRMHLFDVEKLFERLRSINGGKLPYCLTTKEQVLAFAGEAALPLAEIWAVIENARTCDAFPSLTWVREQYETFIKWMGDNDERAKLLVDPPVQKPAPPAWPAMVPVQQAGTPPSTVFDTIVDGSTSNLEDKECLDSNLQTSSPGGTLTGSRTSLSMGKKSSRPMPSPSTPTPVQK